MRTADRLQARVNQGDNTLRIEFYDIGLIEIPIADLIKMYKDKYEVLEALIKTTREQFNNI